MASVLLSYFYSSIMSTFDRAQAIQWPSRELHVHSAHRESLLGSANVFPFGNLSLLLAVFLLYKIQSIFVTYWIRRPVRRGNTLMSHHSSDWHIAEKNCDSWSTNVHRTMAFGPLEYRWYCWNDETSLCKGIASNLARKVSSDSGAQSGGKAFAVPSIARYSVYISDSKDITDLNNASPRDLSFNRALDDVSDLFLQHF